MASGGGYRAMGHFGLPGYASTAHLSQRSVCVAELYWNLSTSRPGSRRHGAIKWHEQQIISQACGTRCESARGRLRPAFAILPGAQLRRGRSMITLTLQRWEYRRESCGLCGRVWWLCAGPTGRQDCASTGMRNTTGSYPRLISNIALR